MARRGRAWGNALGGYKRQRRDSKGRFTSGSVGGRAKRAKRRYQNRGGPVRTTVRTASKRKYNKANLNKQLQRNHRATIAGSYVAVYGGQAAGAALGGAMAGPTGAMLGARIGPVVGQVTTQNYLKKRNMLVTDQQFLKAGKDDQAAMARRIKRAQKGHLAINMAGATYGAHRAMKMDVNGRNGYDLAASIIKQKRGARNAANSFAKSRGIPRVGSKQRYARAGRFGKNKGVYNISSMGPSQPFMRW